jgi:tetratricopeptide (TPR) repeat protein
MTFVAEARSLYDRGMLKEAEAKCRGVLQREPKLFEALYLLGLIKLRQSAPVEACGFLEQAAAANPNAVEALSSLAYVLVTVGRSEEALAICDRTLSLAPNDAGTRVTRGNALFRTGRLEEALESYDAALEINGRSVEALIGRGTALAKLRRFDEAVATFDRIPVGENPAYLHNRANLLLSLGLLSAAARDYNTLIRVSAHPLPAWTGLARCASEGCD